MSVTIGIANFIREQLRTIIAKSYYREVPEETAFPYVLFNIGTQTLRENNKDIMLEIDVLYNTGNNITDFENTVDAIEEKFDDIIYRDTTQNLHFRLENILELSEMYTHLRRKQLRFLLKYYKK